MDSESFRDSLFALILCVSSKYHASVPDPLCPRASEGTGCDILMRHPDARYTARVWSHTAYPLSPYIAWVLCYSPSPHVPVRARNTDISTSAVKPAWEGHDG
jgi:hypothetical protein